MDFGDGQFTYERQVSTFSASFGEAASVNDAVSVTGTAAESHVLSGRRGGWFSWRPLPYIPQL